MSEAAPDANGPSLRPAAVAMDLERLGRQFPTRLSFMRVLTRAMCRERWRIEREHFELDDDGAGCAVYRIATPRHSYRMVLFAHALDPAQRSDRVIAEAWDVTATLCDGPVDAERRRFLARQVPRQEAGRLDSACLVLTRANRSSRQFDRVVAALAAGAQPSVDQLTEVGYLYRTTAVYGSGKFGMSEWRHVQRHHPDLARPFAAEMLACFMLRHFSFEQVEFLARRASPDTACTLDPEARRSLGVGNATGLGMAPFLINHPLLIGQWILQRETALARVLDDRTPSQDRRARVCTVLARAAEHLAQVEIDDPEQTECNTRTSEQVRSLHRWLASQRHPLDWRSVMRHAERTAAVEAQQVLESALIEAYPERVDELAEAMTVEEDYQLSPTMRGSALLELIETHYDWALAYDFNAPDAAGVFWYRSEEKLEPRLGIRGVDPGEEREMRLGLAREIASCHQALVSFLKQAGDVTTAEFVLRHPQWRYTVRRLQTLAQTPYGEIQANLLAADVMPIHLLRCKLAFMGVTKFDPRSRLWVRNTMFQGAPLAEELEPGCADDWSFPVLRRDARS
ncbi:MAG: hypothetical protein GTN86_00990 [Xanthomonadales bacterium]|nr:hypothetical protein [Xanthomonadales bacterium]NIN58390.1 hypothetical protein [Xanthomonadales bacterium]NIN73727.1 hypothetical protein [Xanthomonadales bacterium]NIO14525.1 hypothetical protein [Xanthomonadales bacterium]NIP10783.1 hypothetical protein [Xanthomonadales bacterium]